MANKVIIDIEARFHDEVSTKLDGVGKKADQTKKKVEGIGKTKVNPKIGADDSKFSKAYDKTKALLKKLAGTKATAVIDAMDRVSNKIGPVFTKLKNFTNTFLATLGIKDQGAMGVINKTTGGLERLTRKTWTALVKVKDMALAPIRTIKNALFSIPTLITAVVSAKIVQKGILEPINLADAYSGAKIGFSTLLGESAGQQMMNEIDKFAKETPFKTSGVIDNVQKMMAYGWDPERVIKDMEIIGDAAAATGKGDEGLASIVYALSEIRSKGKLSTQELNQLASAGIKAKAYLAQGLGYGTSDEGMAKMAADLEKGAVGANQAIDLILQGMQEFDGMMDRTANETVSGLKAQLEDVFEINIARRWGQGLQDGAKRGLGTVVSLLDDAETALQQFGDTVHEVGKTIGNWAADKMENAVKRITEITGSFEFKNASLGEKLNMLWKGVIVDPLSEWWENGGRDKTASAANKIGKKIGEFLSAGIKALLGITDIFKEGGMDASGGMSIAQSFAKGFVDGFDVSGVTQKLKEAISNVWNALPWWGKALVIGYGGSKVAGGINNIMSLVSPVAGVASTGLAKLGYGLTGAGAVGTIGGISGGLAAGAGLGAVTAGVGAWYAGKQFTNAYQSYKAGDNTSAKASFARGAGTTFGIGAGALAGAKIGAGIGTLGGPLGTAVGGLIGAGLGTVVGWFAGDKIARNIEAAKYESQEMKDALKDADTSAEELAQKFEKAVWENQARHFGDIKLSLNEIARISEQLVFGDKLSGFEEFAVASEQVKVSYDSLKKAASDMDRWNWKAGLGVKFNDDEIEQFKIAVDEYINSAKSYVENKHYEFTAAVSLLIDPKSKAGKGILESGNDYYAKVKEDLDKAGKELGDKLSKALEDGIISADESKAIIAAQQKIAEITNKISQAEMEAEFDLIKLKFGGDSIDAESFANMQSQLQTSIDERVSKMDKAWTASVSSIRLQVKNGALKPEEAQKQINELAKGYKAEIEELQAEVKSIQLGIVADAYSEILGKDGAKKLDSALTKALEEGIDPKTWTLEDAKRLLGVDSLTGETAKAIGEYLGAIADQIDSLGVDGKLNVNITVETNNAAEETDKVAQQFKNSLDKDLQSKYEKQITVVIDGQKEIREKLGLEPHEFGIPESLAKTLGINLTGKKIIDGYVVLTAADFGVKNSYSANPAVNVKGTPYVSPLSLSMSSFGIKSSYTYTPSVSVSPVYKTLGSYANSFGGSFRGGIEGFSDGGYVRGGGKLIRVAEEGDPEVIIPLSQRRRDRAMQLWRQTGAMMNVPGFARGGFIGENESRINRGTSTIDGPASGRAEKVEINVGGIELKINVEGGQDVVSAIHQQKEALTEEIAGILNRAIEAHYKNMPAKKGA